MYRELRQDPNFLAFAQRIGLIRAALRLAQIQDVSINTIATDNDGVINRLVCYANAMELGQSTTYPQ
jgi:hypothetical protein